MTIENWYEKKAELLNKIKEAAQKAKSRGDDELDKETMNTEFEGWYKELDEVERTIKNLEAAERRIAETAEVIDKNKPGKDPEVNKESYSKAFEEFLRKGYSRMSTENREILELKNPGMKGELRANQLYTTDAYGGYTIPELMGDKIATAQKFIGGMLTPGLVYNLKTPTGASMTFPTVDDTAVSGYLLTEKTDNTTSATDMTFGVVTLAAYKYTSGMLYVSNELLNDSAFDFAGWLVEQLLVRYYRGVNTALTTGTGSSQPKGIKSCVLAAGDEAGGTRTITRTNLLNLVYTLDRAYLNNATWMFNADTLKNIRALVQSSTYNESPLWQESVRSGEPGTLEGRPWVVNPACDSLYPRRHPIFFGDFKHYYYREAGPLRVIRLNELRAAYDETAFTVLGRIDGNMVAADYPVKSIQCATT
jgi:HK97 family phage major capsid protein